MRCISAPQMLVGMYLTDDSILNQQVDPKGLVLRKAHEDDLIPRVEATINDHVETASPRPFRRSEAPPVRMPPQFGHFDKVTQGG